MLNGSPDAHTRCGRVSAHPGHRPTGVDALGAPKRRKGTGVAHRGSQRRGRRVARCWRRPLLRCACGAIAAYRSCTVGGPIRVKTYRARRYPNVSCCCDARCRLVALCIQQWGPPGPPRRIPHRCDRTRSPSAKTRLVCVAKLRPEFDHNWSIWETIGHFWTSMARDWPTSAKFGRSCSQN